MANVKYINIQSNASHVWIDKEEEENGVTYCSTVGMIMPSENGYMATAATEEEEFPTFEKAKAFIIQQHEEFIGV